MSASTKRYADMKIQNRRVIMFAKSNDPDSQKAKQILNEYMLSKGNLNYKYHENNTYL